MQGIFKPQDIVFKIKKFYKIWDKWVDKRIYKWYYGNTDERNKGEDYVSGKKERWENSRI